MIGYNTLISALTFQWVWIGRIIARNTTVYAPSDICVQDGLFVWNDQI